MFKIRQSVYTDDELIVLSDDSIEKPYRLTPFIVTFCTGSISEIDIRRLIESGLHIIRFKMSNVTRRDKIKLLSMLESAVKFCCEKYEVSTWPIAVSIDLPHFCIRTGRLCQGPDKQYHLTKGDIVEITSNVKYCESCSNSRIYIDDHNVLKKVKEGTEVTLSKGNISLICTKVVDFETIECKVVKEGELGNCEYICFRGVTREVPTGLSKIDLELIEFAKEFRLDILIIKVVHSPMTLKEIRALYADTDTEVPLLISTISDQEGLDNIDTIIEESDGIILAREFLAFQIADMYQMHAIQLQVGAKCRKLGKPFFISGNILESILQDGKISLGDLSDITNAVSHRTGLILQDYQGADNLIQAVKLLDSVCRSVESRTKDIQFWLASKEIKMPVNAAEACILGCAIAARQMRALVIILPTVSGKSAVHVTHVATDKIILTVSSSPTVARKLQIYYGVIPIIYGKKAKKDWQEEMAARIKFAVSYGIRHKLLKYGSTYVTLRKSDPNSSYADTINILTATFEEEEHTSDPLKISPYKYRRCPVFVTLTDSQISVVDIQRMLEAGMNIARFKLSRSTRGDKMHLLGKINKASLACCEKYDVTNWPIATCVTLKTCFAKTGLLENDISFINLENNTELILFHNISLFNKCNENNIFVDYPLIAVDVKVGTEISIAADEIILKCICILDETSIKCVVTKGGKLTSMSDLCVRNTKRSGPLVTEKDFEMVEFALQNQVDGIFINYARHPDTIKIIKKYIASKKVRRPLLLAGISSEECLENINDIIKESDGIILSRQHLPYEVESSKQYRMPQIQKWIAGKCLQAGKSLYIYGVFNNALRTGFFINNEISDVTNAIMDGVSGFILAECSSPDNIIEVLYGINQLCYTVEPLVTSKINFKRIIDEVKMPINAAEATAMSCATVAIQTNARVIIIPTVSGRTLRLLQLMRPSCLMIAVSSDGQVIRHLISYRGVFPLLYNGFQHKNWHLNLEARIFFALEYAVKRNWVVYGDNYITLQRGSDTSSFCDTLSIGKVSIEKKSLVECSENYEENYLF
ncbi:uncharacterized protein LOC123867900 [Maniola jurtina]|uniref:uncharacterized protein LOC123867900 n=1 Tax=Maniola jurtina TaxID=191418 RepID=UPI001E686F82|nr:uncharacterized protein LOC123867900 [Maniola jurtina]